MTTTAEALAVVRRVVSGLPRGNTSVWNQAPDADAALAALALIEQRLEENSRLVGEWQWEYAQEHTRAGKAEAERDELKQRATENWDSYENANRRIEELEAALRRIVSDGEFAPFASPTHFGRIARRALGGGE